MELASDHLHAAEQALREGHAHTALDEARLVLRTQPENGQALALMGLAHALMGDEPEAKDDFGRAVEIAPLDSRVRYHCYLGLCRLGDRQGARTQLTYFCQLEPKHQQAVALLTQLGGAVANLPPLPRPPEVLWYDGGGHALTDAGDIAAAGEEAEPPPGPNVVDCPDCGKRTWKGWVCNHCGMPLPRV